MERTCFEITACTDFPVPLERLAAQITTLDGINAELAPLLKMTGGTELPLNQLAAQRPLGRPLFTSWILLFGLIPVDRMQVTLAELGPRGFVEQSPMLFMRHWRHARTLEPVDGGCRLTDTVSFAPRLPAIGRWIEPLIQRLFSHRHAQLGRRFGRLE